MSKPSIKSLEAGMMKRRSAEVIGKNMASAPFGLLTEEAKESVSIPLSQIISSPFQCRADIDEEHIESLLDSINRDGLLSPIVVRVLGSAGSEHVQNRIKPEVSLGDTSLDLNQPVYELIIGHHRVEVFRRMRRPTIPASIRHMDDREAAMALTADNTTHKQLTHWELYKHIEMLERLGMADNNSALARLLNFPRSNVIYLKSFGALPASAKAILDMHPGLIGYKTADALKAYSKSHPAVVHEALEAAANKKIKDAGILSFVERVVNPKDKIYHEEQTIKRNGRSVKVTMTQGFTKVSNEIDPKKLLVMINEHFDSLLKD